MIRLVVRLDDASMAANVGGGVHTTFRTFNIELPALEGILMASGQKPHEFGYATIVGAEVIPDDALAPSPETQAIQALRKIEAAALGGYLTPDLCAEIVTSALTTEGQP